MTSHCTIYTFNVGLVFWICDLEEEAEGRRLKVLGMEISQESLLPSIDQMTLRWPSGGHCRGGRL